MSSKVQPGEMTVSGEQRSSPGTRAVSERRGSKVKEVGMRTSGASHSEAIVDCVVEEMQHLPFRTGLPSKAWLDRCFLNGGPTESGKDASVRLDGRDEEVVSVDRSSLERGSLSSTGGWLKRPS